MFLFYFIYLFFLNIPVRVYKASDFEENILHVAIRYIFMTHFSRWTLTIRSPTHAAKIFFI